MLGARTSSSANSFGAHKLAITKGDLSSRFALIADEDVRVPSIRLLNNHRNRSRFALNADEDVRVPSIRLLGQAMGELRETRNRPARSVRSAVAGGFASKVEKLRMAE